MGINRTGFEATSYGLNIAKDPSAVLTYTLDWGTNWLETGDGIATQSVSVAARSNDPDPVTVAGSGIVDNKTYARLSGGVSGKQYTVTTTVTTNNGLVDSRAYKVYVENRYG
jgi:hypothetical protein